MFLSLALATILNTQADEPMIDLVNAGKVATLSTDYKGTPFGSLTPYALDGKGCPILFLSNLAVHTKNIKKNPKCSIMVSKIDAEDPFNSARITFVGKLVRIDNKHREKFKEIFLKRQKTSEQFIDFADFHFYYIEIESIHYIGGFGDIDWIAPADYTKAYKKE